MLLNHALIFPRKLSPNKTTRAYKTFLFQESELSPAIKVHCIVFFDCETCAPGQVVWQGYATKYTPRHADNELEKIRDSYDPKLGEVVFERATINSPDDMKSDEAKTIVKVMSTLKGARIALPKLESPSSESFGYTAHNTQLSTLGDLAAVFAFPLEIGKNSKGAYISTGNSSNLLDDFNWRVFSYNLPDGKARLFLACVAIYRRLAYKHAIDLYNAFLEVMSGEEIERLSDKTASAEELILNFHKTA